jgi:hypothetical protein
MTDSCDGGTKTFGPIKTENFIMAFSRRYLNHRVGSLSFRLVTHKRKIASEHMNILNNNKQIDPYFEK